MSDFDGKVVLITGGASGIGEACAKHFASEGANVVITDINEEDGKRVAGEINGMFVKADSSSAEDNETMVAKAVEAYGKLDIAVNNAGIGGPAAPTGEYPLDGWHQVININLNGVFYGMRYEIPAMLENGGGAIVNIASILGSVGFGTASAYVAAKHGVVGLTKTAAIEYAPHGIRINSVGPGFIHTPLLDDNLDAETQEMIAGMHPVGRMGNPEEVAALVAFLASDTASFLTGGYYLVDGGYTSQ